MQPEGWERIYRKKGDLQYQVLPKIKRAVKVFKEMNYKKILDLGCGTGKHSIYLAKQGFYVYATDISPTGIDIARQKARLQGLDNIQFKQHDMRDIAFADSIFDAVICTWTIYHGTLKEIQKTIGEIHRVLKSDGTAITDFLSTKDSTYGFGREVEKNTFIGEKNQEEDLPHHYTTREELVKLFSEFQQLKVRASSQSYLDDEGERYLRKYYNVKAIK